MKAIIHPGLLKGSIEAIPSKSEAHRLIICAALATEPTRILLERTSEDIEATLDCIKNIGCAAVKDDLGITITPEARAKDLTFDCRESGSTLRFMLPIAAALFDRSAFKGSGRLPKRPMEPLLDAMEKGGAKFSSRTLPFSVEGKLTPGEYAIAGNISSQYITGLLFALSLLKGESVIKLTTRLESRPYVDITLEAMGKFGVKPSFDGNSFYISPARYHSPGIVKVGGDWSNAAFFLTAACLGSKVSVENLDPSSAQGDKAILQRLDEFAKNRCINCDISQTPDMLPILTAAAAMGEGKSVFTGGARLKTKESDRLASCEKMINDLGGKAEADDNSITVWGTGLRGGVVDSFADHRIVMAAAIAGTVCKEDVVIQGAEAVNKSYPGFFEDFIKLGGRADVI